jgi:hypothetical protein
MDIFKNLKINVAYNRIIVYDVNNIPLFATSNIENYNVHPWHTIACKPLSIIEDELGIKFPHTYSQSDSELIKSTLSKYTSQNLEHIFDNTYNTFRKGTVDGFYSKKEKFIYPIILYNNDLFNKYESIELSDVLIKSLHEGYGKIVFMQPTEGFFGQQDSNFIWIDNLCKKYNFTKQSVIVITSNMKAGDTFNKLINNRIITNSFIVYPHSHFKNNIWFHSGKKLNPKTKALMQEVFNASLNSNKNYKKIKHFLNFNRVLKTHRIALFGEFNSNDKLKGKAITTLSRIENGNKLHCYDVMNAHISNDYRHSKEKLLSFYKDYDSTKHSIYDEPDLENNKASNFNVSAHNKTFVNVVSESLINDDAIFFSEKIFKPMFAAQPFILFGNPNSLEKLKEAGIQTFDKWWDESYDREINFSKRLEKIVDVLEEIASWDYEKCFQITQEMESVLINNFEKMLLDDDIINLYKVLSNGEIATKNFIKKLI